MTDHPPIQIVDEHDRPVGGASIYEAYEKGLIHRVAFIWVEDTDGKILIQKRGPGMATFPDCWDVSAAGHVDVGETYEQAARRELKEELGLEADTLQEVASFYHEITVNRQLLKRFNKVYRVVVQPNPELQPDPIEVTATRWLTKRGITQLIKDHPDEVANGLVDTMKSYEDYQRQTAA